MVTVLLAAGATVVLLTVAVVVLALILRDTRRELRLAERTVATVERFVACLEQADRIASVTSCERTRGGAK